MSTESGSTISCYSYEHTGQGAVNIKNLECKNKANDITTTSLLHRSLRSGSIRTWKCGLEMHLVSFLKRGSWMTTNWAGSTMSSISSTSPRNMTSLGLLILGQNRSRPSTTCGTDGGSEPPQMEFEFEFEPTPAPVEYGPHTLPNRPIHRW